jgi:hypothetical protein
MTNKKFPFVSIAFAVAVLAGSMSAQAATPVVKWMDKGASDGVPYFASISFSDSGTVSLKTGDALPGGPLGTETVDKLGYRSWYDNSIDADGDGKESLMGWLHNSRWVQVNVGDLLKAGYTKARIRATLARYDDRNHSATDLDDDLVPGITAWRGVDTTSAQLDMWYPNIFQTNEGNWWAAGLVNNPLAADAGAPAYPSAVIDETVTLSKTSAPLNKFTLALGGNDTRLTAVKHTVNFKLTVQIVGVK